MKNEHVLLCAGIALALVGFLPEIYTIVRASRFHLLTVGTVLATVGLVLLYRQPEPADPVRNG